jgi:D-sedoheptulose 7-phosphate isomerase
VKHLYPFLYAPRGQPAVTLSDVVESVRQSTLAKCADVVALRRRVLHEEADHLVAAATAMAAAFARGATLLAFGNGGSATDASDAAADCVRPPRGEWRALPAIALTEPAIITGVGNDVGIEHIFLRQIIALGQPGDIALGFSTGGTSRNVVAAFAEAKRRNLVTVGLAGYDGGAMRAAASIDYCLVARHEYVPRIQEAHATMWHTLLELVHELLASPGSRP